MERIVERGSNYIIRDLGGNKRSWESQPQWVYDSIQWVPYIYVRDEAKKCHRVSVGLVGAEIYDSGDVTLYDPQVTEVRVKNEYWELWSAGKEATLDKPITWSVIQNSLGVFITRRQTTSKPNGTLEITYVFRVGSGLKHIVKWTANGAASNIQVKQVHLMDFDKVATEAGIITSKSNVKSPFYLFQYGLKDFWLLETHHTMVYDSDGKLLTEKCLQTSEIDFAGKKVTYTFGDWTLASGESLEVDPDSATLNDPTEDGFIYYLSSYGRNNSGPGFRVGKMPTGYIYRAYVEWPISSIPDAATITDTIFKYHGLENAIDCHIHEMLGARPSTSTDTAVYAEAGEGTVYADPAGFPVVGTNKQVDLGISADADLQSQLTLDWFAIGIQSDNEGTANSGAYFASEENPTATPKATLYVEYSTGAIIVERSTSENISVSDAIERAVRRDIPLSESPISVSDLPTYNLLKAVAVYESSISASDTTERNLTRITSSSEPAISVSDVVSLILRRVRDISEPSISITDAIEKAMARSIFVSEPVVSVGDLTSYILHRAVSISEPAINISDLASYISQRAVVIDEPSLSVSDGIALALTRIIIVSEPAISMSDLTDLKFIRDREISEPQISLLDGVDYQLRRTVMVSEPSMSLSDAVSYALQRERAVAEPSISLIDETLLILRRVADIFEPAINISDAVSHLLQRHVTISETLGFVVDAVIISTPFVSRLVSEDLGFITDTLNVGQFKERMLTESLGLLGETLLLELTHVGVPIFTPISIAQYLEGGMSAYRSVAGYLEEEIG